MLDDTAMTDAEKLEFVQTVRDIMQGFVDRAFGLGAVRLACGEDRLGGAQREPKAVESNVIKLTPIYMKAANDEDAGKKTA